MLDQDSGYGGSIADGDAINAGWNPGTTEDRFTPSQTPVKPGDAPASCQSPSRLA